MPVYYSRTPVELYRCIVQEYCRTSGTTDYSSNPPTARKPSTTRLYSQRSSFTSDNRRSSATASKKRRFGGAMRGIMGDVGRLDRGVSTRVAAGVGTRGGGRSDVCRDGDGEA